jgi:cytochrome c oxidase subunit 2
MPRAAHYVVGAAALIIVALSGCSAVPDQSTLHPAGPAAAEIARLWWVMCAAFTVVFILVIALLGFAIAGRSKSASPEAHASEAIGDAPPWGRTGFIVAGGVILPIVILTPLYLYSLITSAGLRMPTDALTVRVVGHMWWWEVRYPANDIVTANEIYIPVGRPVRLELASVDVIHSFWVPTLNGKRDMIPGIENVFWIQADAPGVYRGQCGEYCGTQHANMALEVIALPPEEFAAWTAARSQPRPEPTTEEARRGRQVFLTAGCTQCHAVRGLPSRANVGPDLTDLASRRMIGGAMRSNTREELTKWVVDSPSIKPGIKMPKTVLPPEQMHDLISYLEELK